MSLRTVSVIARKELRDVLRDRRTLFFMMLLPIVVMPLLMLGVSKFMQSQNAQKAARVLTIAAEPAAVTTLTALTTHWLNENWVALSLGQGKAVLDGLGGRSALEKLMKFGEQAEGDAKQGIDFAQLAKLSADMPSEQRQLMLDAHAISKLVSQSKFVDPASLDVDGQLAQGVKVPKDLPDSLAGERMTIAVQSKAISAGLALPGDALVTLEEFEATVPLHVLYDSSQSLSDEAYDRVHAFLDVINRQQLKLRLREEQLPREFAEPMRLESANVATDSRKVQAAIGGLLPYLLFAFCFFGALYPALDVTAGEKERFTMETLLLAPVSRLEIACGKFVVVFLAAVVAAVLTTSSMVASFTYGILPPNLAEAFEIEFQPLALLLTGSLVVPVAALYSALLLAVGLYARSFKEAQSYTVPLQFVMILPMMVSLLPDVEAESHMAWIPFVNISLLMKELLKGNYLWSFYIITLGSTLVVTVLALFGAAWMFRRESVMMRS